MLPALTSVGAFGKGAVWDCAIASIFKPTTIRRSFIHQPFLLTTGLTGQSPSLAPRLNRKKPVKERPVAPQGLPQVLRRGLTAPAPIAFELGTLVREYARQLLNHRSNQLVGLLHRWLGFIHKAGLDIVPLFPELLRVAGRKESLAIAGNQHRGGAIRLSGRSEQIRGRDVFVFRYEFICHDRSPVEC